jgi:RES domain-containing protein
MLSERKLRRVLERLPLITLEGPFHRFADFWFVHHRLVTGETTDLLKGLGARMFGGRFTPPEKFETLYVATTAEAARLEAEFILTGSGVVSSPAKPYAHFTISGLVNAILDLTDPINSGIRRYDDHRTQRSLENVAGAPEGSTDPNAWTRRARNPPCRRSPLSVEQERTLRALPRNLPGPAREAFVA